MATTSLGCSICWLDTTQPLLQVQLCFLVAAVVLIGSASASQNEATFDFNYGFNPAVISMDMVDYTDSAGTALRVSIRLERCSIALHVSSDDVRRKLT